MKASEILDTQEAQEAKAEEAPISIDESAETVDWENRPRLTLRKLHRLRLISQLKKLEAAEKQEFVARMYGGTFEESDEKEKDSRTPPKAVKAPRPFKPLEPSSKYLDKHTRS